MYPTWAFFTTSADVFPKKVPPPPFFLAVSASIFLFSAKSTYGGLCKCFSNIVSEIAGIAGV